MLTPITPNYIDYTYYVNAKKRIDERYDSWKKDKNIEELMREPELFGNACIEYCSWPDSLWKQKEHEDRKDFENIRSFLAEGILSQQNFKIYAIWNAFHDDRKVFLKKQNGASFYPTGGIIFEVDILKREEKIEITNFLSILLFLKKYVNLQDLVLKIPLKNIMY